LKAQTPAQDSQPLVRFASGDSVELIKSGPIYLATGQAGFLISFQPFVAIEDTLKLRVVAGEVWTWLRPHLDSNPPPFAVLQATTARSRPTLGIQQAHGYNFVVERHADGKWYFVNETKPSQ